MTPLYCLQVREHSVAYKRNHVVLSEPSPTSAILNDRDCYDRNDFPTVNKNVYLRRVLEGQFDLPGSVHGGQSTQGCEQRGWHGGLGPLLFVPNWCHQPLIKIYGGKLLNSHTYSLSIYLFI